MCNIYLDESSTYLEAVAFASDKKARLLPIVAPEVGIVGKCWAEDTWSCVGWEDLRALVASQSSCCQRQAKLDLMVGYLDI